jgi:hypothetical protein
MGQISKTMFAHLSKVALLLALVLPAQAQEAKRLALLIGNQGYSEKVGPLKNPLNDVALIEASLKQLGFRSPSSRTPTTR